MKTINERVAELRDVLKFNQTKFGKAIGLSTSGISSIENGTRKVTDQHIKLICSELNVNEVWLKTGQGEMFVEDDSTIIAELASEYNLDAIDQKIIEHYVKLDDSERQKLKNHVVSLAQTIVGLEESAATIEPTPEQIAEEEAEAYRQEVLAELKGATLSASVEQNGKSS